MIAQHQVNGMDHSGRPPIRYGALVKCMSRVRALIKDIVPSMSTSSSICCPRFGCGLAGGDEKVILQLIQEIWIDKNIDVTIYVSNSPGLS